MFATITPLRLNALMLNVPTMNEHKRLAGLSPTEKALIPRLRREVASSEESVGLDAAEIALLRKFNPEIEKELEA